MTKHDINQAHRMLVAMILKFVDLDIKEFAPEMIKRMVILKFYFRISYTIIDLVWIMEY